MRTSSNERRNRIRFFLIALAIGALASGFIALLLFALASENGSNARL